MSEDRPLFGNDDLIRSLRSALQDREHALKSTPGLLLRTLETEAWRDFHTPLKEHVTHDRFEDFVTADPFDGLGITMDLVRALAKEEPELQRKLREAVPRAERVGRPSEKHCDTNIKPDTTEHVVARLKRDDPELAERVVSGEITPNAAARIKGWRKPRVVVTNPESVARKLREHFTPQELDELRRLLEET